MKTKRTARPLNPERLLRGLLRRDGSRDHLILLVENSSGLWLCRVNSSDVCGFRRISGSDDFDCELTLRRGANVAVRRMDLLTIGGHPGPSRVGDGVPFILATPHHVRAIHNPESMGGSQPVDPWGGALPIGQRAPR